MTRAGERPANRLEVIRACEKSKTLLARDRGMGMSSNPPERDFKASEKEQRTAQTGLHSRKSRISKGTGASEIISTALERDQSM